MNKICNKCNIEKELDRFSKVYYKKVNGDPIGDGHRSICRSCDNLTRKLAYDSNPITRMLKNAKGRSKQYNMEFNITSADVPIPEKCPILEITLVLGKANMYDFAPSIDRLDSSKGYVKGNVRVVSFMANKMKSNATKEQCLTFAKNIQKYYD